MSDSPVILITGSRKGIGLALVRHYAAAGWRVVGCSRQAMGEEIPNYRHVCLDVIDEIAVKKLFASIRTSEGRLDALVNNAGIASMNHSLLTPLSTVQRVLGTNVTATFLFCREAARLMQGRRYGRIVNFTTVAVPLKLEGEAVYAASKAAVISLTEVLAREFADFGVTVNAIGPTPIQTDLIRGVPAEKLQRLIDRQAIRRFGVVEDVVNVVDFYLRHESSFITGQVLFLGGI
jgi:3-oxoacyl-[acyl-carrier protein] reductase